MAYLTPDAIDDLTELTLPYFRKHKWVEISTQFPEYFTSRMITDKRVVYRGGTSIKFKVKYRQTGNARVSGLYDQDNTKVDDIAKGGNVPWAKITGSYGWDIDEDGFSLIPRRSSA